MTRPESFTLSTEAGEAILARLSVYAPSRADCEMLMQVVRVYFGLMATLEEAKLSLKKLRTLLCGRSPKRPKGAEPASSSVSDFPVGDGEATGDALGRDERPVTAEAAGARSGWAASASAGKPQGGHRPGTGRLGAHAYVGAERVECRHEELAVGQRCPVCGHGTL
jgi:hypothetical protein